MSFPVNPVGSASVNVTPQLTLSLPMYPELKPEQIERVAETLAAALHT